MSEAKGLLTSVTLKNRRSDKIMGALPDAMPWPAIAAPWAHAEDSLARLDQALAMSELRDAWIARADVVEAAASVWLVMAPDLWISAAWPPALFQFQEIRYWLYSVPP